MSAPDVRAIRTQDLPEEAFPEVRSEFRVVLAEGAFDRAVARGEEDSDREIGGVLVGRLCRDAGGPFVRVDTTIDALHAEEKGTELTFTHETWAHVHEVMDRDHPDLQIVGWYHTHPGFGIFLSDRDVFIHRSFFDLPHQVALVYDPRSREHGVFTWRDGEPERSRRYWIGAAEQTWEPSSAPKGETAEAKEKARRTEQGETAESAGPPPVDRFSLAIGAIILLVLGGMAGWWLGGRSDGELLERHRQEIQAAKLLGASEMVRRLDLELVELLRRSLDRDATRRSLTALARADRGRLVLEKKDPPPDEEARKKALEDVREGLRGLRSTLDAQLGVVVTLDAFAAARKSLGDPRETRRAVGLHAAALALLCVEMAEDAKKAGDVGRARRLLTIATQVDPGKRALYEEKLGALGAGEGGTGE